MSNSQRPHGLQPTRLLRSWDFPGKSTRVGCHYLLRANRLGFLNYQLCDYGLLIYKHRSKVKANKILQSIQHRLHCPWDFPGKSTRVGCHCFLRITALLLLLLLSRFSRVRLCATPLTAAHQAPPSLGFSRQEHWSGLPFPSPMHESEK